MNRSGSWVNMEPVVQYFDPKKAKEWLKEKIGSEDKVETEVVAIKVSKAAKDDNVCDLDQGHNYPGTDNQSNIDKEEDPDDESKPNNSDQVFCKFRNTLRNKAFISNATMN